MGESAQTAGGFGVISVLLPTRGRPALLASSVFSLWARASDPANFEILVAWDADDEISRPMIDDLRDAGRISDTIEFTERAGYAQLHTYYNALSVVANGTWLYEWNDDAVVLTDGWDEIIMEEEPTRVLHTIRKTRFPVVPKAWVDLVGHYSLDRHCDTWWDEVSRKLKRVRYVPIEGAHAVPDDQTAAEREYDVAGLLAKSNLIDADVAKIRATLT